jgi:hypothetical protein
MFSVVSGVGLAVGMLLMIVAVATMILLVVSPFIGGCGAGVVIETARGRLLRPASEKLA